MISRGGVIGAAGAASGASKAAFSDNFNRTNSSSLGASWTEVNGGHWEISSNTLRYNTQNSDEVAIYTGTSVNSSTNYVRLKLLNASNTTGNMYDGAVFRYTNSSSPFYVVTFGWTGSASQVYLMYVASGTFSTYSTIGTGVSMTIAANDVVGITLTGTGASTRIRVWKNPTATTPVSVSEWDSGDTTPDADFTVDPGASNVASGPYLGVYGYGAGGQYMSVDDFYGGDA